MKKKRKQFELNLVEETSKREKINDQMTSLQKRIDEQKKRRRKNKDRQKRT